MNHHDLRHGWIISEDPHDQKMFHVSKIISNCVQDAEFTYCPQEPTLLSVISHSYLPTMVVDRF